MRAKRYYTEDLQTQKIDAILIGSGIGCLSTAAFLVKAGKRVLVIERHSVLGGYIHTYQRSVGGHKFEWDIGLHYVGIGQPDAIGTHAIIDYLTDGAVSWADMGAVYDVAVIAGERYEYIAGMDNQIANLTRHFPTEAAAIRAYYELVAQSGAWSAMYFAEKTMPRLLSKTVGYFLRKSFLRYASQTTREVILSFTKNEKLIAVLTAQWGNYGLPPSQSSFMAHAVIVNHYMQGGSYPVGGSSAVVDALIARIEQGGSRVIANSGVSEIIIQQGRATGVKLDNGTTLSANIIISGIGAHNTLSQLLPELASKPIKALRNKVMALKKSTAHLSLSIGLLGTASELGLPKHNIWEYDSYDMDTAYHAYERGAAALPNMRYYSFPSAKDTAWQTHSPGTSSIQIVMLCDYSHFAAWEDTKWQQRGEQYEAMKQALTDKLLDKLYALYPLTRGKVILTDLSTPLSTKHFNYYTRGEIYGLTHSPARFMLQELRIPTPISNLLLTGQDTICVGVGAAVASGMLTASLILKKNLLGTIQATHLTQPSSIFSKPLIRITTAIIRLRNLLPSSDKVY
jgi:all-trans-retinol 13,14-reductase